jgi:GT2 family glycosyltransferase
MMKIAVVTALWYEDRFLPGLFASLERCGYPRESWEIIMVDNKNSEKTRRWIELNVTPKIGSVLPNFTLLKTDRNLGFAGGNNACIEEAVKRGCEAVYLLNEDAHGEPDFLEKSAARLAADPKIAAVQSFLVLDPPENGMNSIGNSLHFLGFSYCDGYRMPRIDAAGYLRVRAISDPRLTISAFSGAAALLRLSALERVGVFDESYHLYHEDLDLSLRLREAGYDLTVEPSSVVYHRYEFGRSAEKYYWMERNRYRLLLEHYRIWTLVVLRPGLVAAELGLLAFSAKNGTLFARLRAYVHILDPRNWAEIGSKRERLKILRKRSDREILKTAASSIGYQETEMPAMRIFNAAMAAYWAVAKRLIF